MTANDWQGAHGLTGGEMAKILGVTETRYSLVRNRQISSRFLRILLYYERWEKTQIELMELRAENIELKNKIKELEEKK